MELKEVKKFLEKLNPGDIVFDSHFYKRLGERPINEGIVRSFLFQLDRLEKIEKGKVRTGLSYGLK